MTGLGDARDGLDSEREVMMLVRGGIAERGSHAYSVPSERPCQVEGIFEPQRVTCLHAIGCWGQWYL